LADQIVRNLKIKHNKHNKHNNESSAIILLFNNMSLPPSHCKPFTPQVQQPRIEPVDRTLVAIEAIS